MKTNDQQLGLPTQCIQTKQAFIDGYGEERGMDVINSNIEVLTEAHKLISGLVTVSSGFKLKIAFQIDFWTQTKEANLKGSPMELLKEAYEKLYQFNLEPMSQKIDEKSPDFELLKKISDLID